MPHRILLTCAFLLSLICTVQAQFSAGISGGASRTFWYWYIQSLDRAIDLPSGTSWRVSIPLEYQFSPTIGLRAELTDQVFCQSRKVTLMFPGNPLDPGQKVRIRECYNSVGGSMLVKVSPIKKLRKLYLLTGPTVACFTHAWRHYNIEGDDNRKESLDLDKNNVQRAQLLVDSGLGYNLAIGQKNRLLLEFRYQYGLTGISEYPNVSTGIQSAVVNLGFVRSF